MKQIVVVGGGPAGMTAAISAARAGARVTLLESGQKAGRMWMSKLKPVPKMSA